MATTVSSGGVSTQGSRTYVFGSSSGIDTSALVEAAYNQRVSEADKIDVKITANTKKSEAYTTLQTLSKAVQTSLTNLRQSYGFANTNTNYAFQARSGSMTTNNTTDPTKLLGVTIDQGTALGSYQIEVVQKAKANRIGSDTTTDPTVALGSTGSFNLSLGGGTSSTINVTSGMSMNDLATAINASSSTSGVTASVLKISSTSYQLVLTGTETAKNITVSGVTGTDVLTNIGVTTSSGGAAKNTLQASAQAILKLDGVQVTRDTNQISDLISGVNLTIANAEPGTLIDLDVTNDNSAIKSNIVAFTDAYNALRDFIVTNQTVTGGVASADAVLFGDNILKMVTTAIQPLVGSKYGSGGTNMSTLAELGLTLDGNNKFVVDETKLDTAILDHYDEVKSIFQTSYSSDNTQFTLLGNTSKLSNLSVAISITRNNNGITGVYVNGDGSLFDVSGTSITGKKGTIYEGLSFAYVGTTNTTVNFNMSQGAADLISNTLDNFTDPVNGVIQNQILDLGDLNTDMAARADRVRERADDFRTKLIDKYARYETAIANSKSIIAQLKAILGTTDNS